MQQPPTESIDLTPAPIVPRIVAAVIDLIVVAMLLVLMGLIFGGSEKTNADGSSGASIHLSGLPAILFFVLSTGYFVLLEGTTGQTLGKAATSLKVAGPGGEAIGLGKAFVRTLCRAVDFLPLLYLVGFVLVAATKKRQRIGDMAAGSTVIKAPEPAPRRRSTR